MPSRLSAGQPRRVRAYMRRMPETAEGNQTNGAADGGLDDAPGNRRSLAPRRPMNDLAHLLCPCASLLLACAEIYRDLPPLRLLQEESQPAVEKNIVLTSGAKRTEGQR